MSKKIFITGSTGFIGRKLAMKLAQEDNRVVALIRSKQKAKDLQHDNISFVEGDLFSTDAIAEGMEGCDEVYHLAAFASVWAKDDTFHRVNILGTENILDIAQKQGVGKCVVTSTAGVIGPAIDGPVNEDTPRQVDFFTDYESTKYESELKIKERVRNGQHVVIVNPTRVYGPGPLNVSNSVTKLVKQYIEGKWKFMPGDGMSTGNYVFVDDVINGHILAMANGRAGERYLLGGEDATYHELFDTIAVIGGQKHKLYKMPLGVMLTFGKLQLFMAERFGRQPMITPGWVRKYLYKWSVSSAKAETELGYKITSLNDGIQQTVNWLKAE
ncbi:farnesol dehydrogenase [Roseivirga pacifica]|uniref:Farnesol dehydrogenase n=1 Tax=Roseivirga pacifica TaxID=1267423 RepID=A0A1I0ME65_9BACT|nr:SDR family oxidoreductase [Roseivirga pacifica]RKQ50281.1 farnesol dehydrogenase [Roseivirga pacifica]SEV86046.1 farnesol dehydrogenase [Roseivirga pacifica]